MISFGGEWRNGLDKVFFFKNNCHLAVMISWSSGV